MSHTIYVLFKLWVICTVCPLACKYRWVFNMLIACICSICSFEGSIFVVLMRILRVKTYYMRENGGVSPNARRMYHQKTNHARFIIC